MEFTHHDVCVDRELVDSDCNNQGALVSAMHNNEVYTRLFPAIGRTEGDVSTPSVSRQQTPFD